MGALLRSAILCVAATTTTAQTFIVDASNGPGTNFTDLATATATVPDGAVLDVRPGAYGSFSIVGKGLSVVFQPGATVQNGFPLSASVSNTSAAQIVLLRRVAIGTYASGIEAHVQINNCQGLALMEDCSVNGTRLGPALIVTRCNQVEATRCTFGEGPSTWTGANLDHSSVVFRTCSVAGGFPGVNATACQLQFVDTAVGGFPIYSIVGPAIQMQGGDLRMVGGSTFSFFHSSIGGIGTARIDPSVVFGGVPAAIEATIQATFIAMPAVVATDGPLGGSVTVDLRGPAGDFGVLLAGFPGPPLSFPGIADPSWMLPGTEVVCASSILASGTNLSITVPVPNVAALRGLRVVWQGASYGATNGLQVSNPAVTTHW